LQLSELKRLQNPGRPLSSGWSVRRANDLPSYGKRRKKTLSARLRGRQESMKNKDYLHHRHRVLALLRLRVRRNPLHRLRGRLRRAMLVIEKLKRNNESWKNKKPKF
jgi:hypothetical protein